MVVALQLPASSFIVISGFLLKIILLKVSNCKIFISFCRLNFFEIHSIPRGLRNLISIKVVYNAEIKEFINCHPTIITIIILCGCVEFDAFYALNVWHTRHFHHIFDIVFIRTTMTLCSSSCQRLLSQFCWHLMKRNCFPQWISLDLSIAFPNAYAYVCVFLGLLAKLFLQWEKCPKTTRTRK